MRLDRYIESVAWPQALCNDFHVKQAESLCMKGNFDDSSWNWEEGGNIE